jgi:hypothetical protein
LQRHANCSHEFTIRAPHSINNVDLSIPHRIIGIALRRGVLEDYDLARDGSQKILYGEELNIRIKETAKDLPIFLRAEPRGLSLTSKPMSAAALSAYIKQRARQVGLVPPGWCSRNFSVCVAEDRGEYDGIEERYRSRQDRDESSGKK